MTPAQQAGFEEGKKYRVISGYGDDHDFPVGTIVTFTRDDGSSCPRFEGENDAGDGYHYPYLRHIDPTPVEKAGLVVGKQYRTGKDSWVGAGHLVTFTKDDGSECPQFQGETAYRGQPFYEVVAKIDPVAVETAVETPAEVAEETPVEVAAVHVSLNGNSTTIVVQRNLTPDEVSAVLKAIGAK